MSLRAGNVTLAGTLVLAAGLGRDPAVVLFHGSGPEPRNLVTARWWAEQGVTALAYDKRGVGQSTADFSAAPFTDLADDGLAGVAWLKARADVDPTRIGVWGLSQGGWLGTLAASRSKDIAFVVAVSGPGVSPGEQMIFYRANELRQAGVPESEVTALTSVRRQVWASASSGQGRDHARAALASLEQKSSNPAVREQLSELDRALKGPRDLWLSKEVNYDPVPALRLLAVPTLFVFGTADTVVPVDVSIAIIRHTLKTTPRADFTIKKIDGARHGMGIVGPDGSVRPSDEYYATMRDWVHAHVVH